MLNDRKELLQGVLARDLALTWAEMARTRTFNAASSEREASNSSMWIRQYGHQTPR
jgi:hypothetical protein